MGSLEKGITAGLAESIDVGVGTDRDSWQLSHLFWCSIINCSRNGCPRYGLSSLGRVGGCLIDCTLLEGKAEDNQLHLPAVALLAHKYIGWFHIPVQDTLLV